MEDAPTCLAVFEKFPWPIERGVVILVMFDQCGIEEEMRGVSKSNVGQAGVVQKVIKLLTTKDAPEEKPKRSQEKGESRR